MRLAPLLVTLAIAAAAAGCGSGEAGPAQADPAPAPPEPVRYESDQHGFSVVIPPGWHRAEEPLSDLTDPVEILAIGTFPPNTIGGDCGPVGLGNFDVDDVLISILERGQDPASEWTDFPLRPDRFAFEPGMTSESAECFSERQGIPLRDHWFRFTDAGRHFHVLVAIGADAPAGRAREAYAILDSLRFDESATPDWRSSG